MERWQGEVSEILKRNKKLGVVLVAGLVLLFSGRVMSFMKAGEEKVEIVSAQDNGGVKLWVDVEGAVVSPGVYEFEGEARVKDALLKAGGLNEKADRNRIARTMNLALKLKDGDKLYFPAEGEVVEVNEGGGGQVLGNSGGKVNINTASVGELDSLWGIGETRARQIIEGRPYASIEEVKEKGGVPSNVFERIQGQIEI